MNFFINKYEVQSSTSSPPALLLHLCLNQAELPFHFLHVWFYVKNARPCMSGSCRGDMNVILIEFQNCLEIEQHFHSAGVSYLANINPTLALFGSSSISCPFSLVGFNLPFKINFKSFLSEKSLSISITKRLLWITKGFGDYQVVEATCNLQASPLCSSLSHIITVSLNTTYVTLFCCFWIPSNLNKVAVNRKTSFPHQVNHGDCGWSCWRGSGASELISALFLSYTDHS